MISRTIIEALKRSLEYDASIVNLSLKISDNLDPLSDSAHLLERLIGLIPYTVAAVVE